VAGEQRDRAQTEFVDTALELFFCRLRLVDRQMNAPAESSRMVFLDLGNAVGSDNRVVAPMTSFAKTDTIHASVATDGSTAGNLTAKWSFQDGQVVDTQDKSVAAGPQVTDFSITKPDGWPAGKYTLEISSGGMVAQTREFEVK